MSWFSDGTKGGMSGASLGSLGGGWGALIGGAGGFLGGSLGLMPGTGDDAHASEDELKDIRRRYDAYRPAAMAAREQALTRALGMYQPMASQLSNKWGMPVNLPNPQGILTSQQLQGIGGQSSPADPKYSMWDDIKNGGVGGAAKFALHGAPTAVRDLVEDKTPLINKDIPGVGRVTDPFGARSKVEGYAGKALDWVF